jgi:glycosyltransferase involved in cell wall biosynthesis
MKISFIIEDGRYGGPHAYAISLIKSIENKHQVKLILPKNLSKPLLEKLNKSQIDYKLLPLTCITKQFIPLLKYIFFSLFEIVNLVIYFKKNNIDVVYVSGGSWQFKGILAAKISNKKVIWHLNDTYAPKIILFIFRKLVGIPEIFVCASSATKEYYFSLLKSNKPIFVIPSPVDTEFFSIKESINHSKSSLTIGMVANINPIKGLEMFIDVAKKLNKNFNNLKFIIVGSVWQSQEKYYSKILEFIHNHKIDNIEFTGQKNDIRPYLKNFDIYLCTSKFESSPISVWEAMSMECAIVSTDVGDVSKYIKSKISGEVVKVGDTNDMVNKISNIIKNPNLMSEYQKKSKEICRNKLDINVCAKSHLEVFKLININ